MPDDPIERHTRKKKTEHSESSGTAEISSSEFAELSGFRRDCLIVIGGLGTAKGLEIKEELEKYYSDTVNHGRLYPNLDTLAEKGLIEKISLDGRSNGYLLAELGKSHIRQRKEWEATCTDELTKPNLDFGGSNESVDLTGMESSADTRSSKTNGSADSSEETASNQSSPDTKNTEDDGSENTGDMIEQLTSDLDDDI